MLEEPGRHLRYALRAMSRRPLLAFAVVVTLAVGISASATIFGFIDHILLRDLPYPRPGELVSAWESEDAAPGEPQPVSESDFADWASQNGLFRALGAFSPWMPTLRGVADPERLVGMSVSAGYFEALGERALVGRTIGPDDDRPGHEQQVVISYGLWRRRFGGDPGVVGKTLTLGEKIYTVLGVMPSWFRHPRPDYHDQVDVWRPLALAPDPAERGSRYLEVVGRLAPKVSLERARGALGGLARSLAKTYPVSNAGWGVLVRPLKDDFVGKLRPGLTALAAAAAFVFLIACINVSNLLLARIPTRTEEMGVRVALGADRRHLLVQLLSECLVLGLAGGALGLLLAGWEMRLLRATLPPLAPGVAEVGVDGPVLGFALLLSLSAVALFGILPSLHTLSSSLGKTLREGAAAVSAGRRSSVVMFFLVAAEVAVTLALLVAGAMLLQSFRALWGVDPGFRPERMLVLELGPRQSKFPTPESLAAYLGTLESRVEALAGTDSAALISNAPFSPWNTSNYFTPEGWSARRDSQRPDAEYRAVSADFFRVLGVRILQGRPFNPADRRGAQEVAVVNHALAERYWPGGDAVGKRLTLEDPAHGHWLTVVGVAADILGSGLAKDARPTVYRPYAQAPQSFMAIMVRAKGRPEALVPSLRRTIAQVDAETAVSNVKTLEGAIHDSLANERGRALVLTLFSVAATLLTAVGLYGVLSTAVSQRTQEFGIRMAIGAPSRKILELALWRGGKVILLGIGLGLLLAFAATRMIRGLLFQVSPADPAIFALAILLELVVGLIATLIPARRAARIDPTMALRPD
ncbi:MAG: ABC transporter permease [Thermoanaerobaculia bacterium]